MPLLFPIKKDDPAAPASWFCVRTHSKREHFAARWLQRHLDLDVYVPRIRFRRVQPRGPVWFVEALFPNYLFARFEPAQSIHQINLSPGVREVVRFGTHCPSIPDNVIESLRATIGASQIRVLDQELQPGEIVKLAGGAFHGLEAVVTSVMPARKRVIVLLDFLGRQTKIELETAKVASLRDKRQGLFQ